MHFEGSHVNETMKPLIRLSGHFPSYKPPVAFLGDGILHGLRDNHWVSVVFTACNLINSSGLFDSCELKCCEGNLCDPDNQGTISPGTISPGTISPGTISPGIITGSVTSSPTSAGRGLAATFVVILLALFLMMYPGNNWSALRSVCVFVEKRISLVVCYWWGFHLNVGF